MIATSFASSGPSWLMRRYLNLRWRYAERMKRIRLAYHYATNKLTEDDAYDLSRACMRVHGVYPLVEFCVEDTLNRAREKYGDVPELEELVRDACGRVWNKWSGDYGDTSGAAEDWAMDLVRDYARDRGITLVDQYQIDKQEEERDE
jgi:hypothetical protein